MLFKNVRFTVRKGSGDIENYPTGILNKHISEEIETFLRYSTEFWKKKLRFNLILTISKGCFWTFIKLSAFFKNRIITYKFSTDNF